MLLHLNHHPSTSTIILLPLFPSDLPCLRPTSPHSSSVSVECCFCHLQGQGQGLALLLVDGVGGGGGRC